MRYFIDQLDFQLSTTPELSYIYSIVVSEVLMRSAKHVFTTYMQGLEMTHLSVAVSHFLNCMLCSASQASLVSMSSSMI